MVDLHRSRTIVNHLCRGQDRITAFPFDGLVTDFHPDRRSIRPDVVNFLPAVETAAFLETVGKLVRLVMETWRNILAHVRVAHKVRDIATAQHFRIGIVDIHSFEILAYNNAYA